MFSCEFCEIFDKTFFKKHLRWLLLNKRNICIYDTVLPIKSCRLIPLKVHSELCRTSKMKLLEKIDNGYKSLTILAKSFILDIWKGSEYVSGPLTGGGGSNFPALPFEKISISIININFLRAREQNTFCKTNANVAFLEMMTN